MDADEGIRSFGFTHGNALCEGRLFAVAISGQYHLCSALTQLARQFQCCVLIELLFFCLPRQSYCSNITTAMPRINDDDFSLQPR